MTEPAATSVPIAYQLRGLKRLDRRAVSHTLAAIAVTAARQHEVHHAGRAARRR